VLGATGGFGGAVARELLARGHRVRALIRNPIRARSVLGHPDNLELIEGSAEDRHGLIEAVSDCALIVHGVNYPYHQWQPYMEVVTVHVLEAARLQRATVLFPGNVLGLGQQVARPLTEDAFMRASTHKGRLRVRLEDSLRRATRDRAVQVIVLRTGDTFGPTVRNGLVDPIFGNAVQARPLQWVGRPSAPHQWAYAPDVARVAVALWERAGELAPFEVFHFAGHIASSQRSFLELVAKLAGRPVLKLRRTPWWWLRIRALSRPTLRELLELRYLFDDAVILNDNRLRKLLPELTATPIEQAVAETLESYRREE
jgi:nucleoside-diphosphate-sugar epimerase